MTRASSNDLDYLATRLHARRSRMAEGERLAELCRWRTVAELERAVLPGFATAPAAGFQRRLAQNLADEIFSSLKHLEGEEQDFIAWLLARYQVENAKVLLRGCLNHQSWEMVQPSLVALPASLELSGATLLAAKSPLDFAGLLPAGSARLRLQSLLAGQREPPPLLLEAALDAGYFHELLTRNSRLPAGELEVVKPLVFQEIRLFEFMLVTRGRFYFGLSAAALLRLRVLGGGESGEWFNGLLSAPDLATAAKDSVGVILDGAPVIRGDHGETGDRDISEIESLAWQRYRRLANNAFRRSHNGVGAVAGYFGVRRREIASLTALSEGIRLGLTETEIRERLLPRAGLEAAHV
jgi:vacuolar-type H+-ATPase subunit C/Vma6